MFNKEALQFLRDHMDAFSFVQADGITTEVVAVADGFRLQSLEQFFPEPDRIKASVSLKSSESFCDYVNRFKGAETSVYIDVDNGQFTALLDHYGEGKPSWCEHVALFIPKKSLPWNQWKAVHDEDLNQIKFAVHIEQQLDSIVEPDPNIVLKAALDFQANEKLTLGSTKNLENGAVRFNFTKDNATQSVTFPHRIKLSLPVHENEDPEIFEARVRYRTDGNGALTFKFQFVKDPRAIERESMLLLAEKTKAGTEGLTHYEGAAPQRR